MSVEEDVEANHDDDEQGPGDLYADAGRLDEFLHIRDLLLALVQQGHHDHGDTDDDEYPEGEHHEMRPEGGSVKDKEVENTCTDGEYGSPGERHVGGTRGTALPENAEQENGRHRRSNET